MRWSWAGLRAGGVSASWVEGQPAIPGSPDTAATPRLPHADARMLVPSSHPDHPPPQAPRKRGLSNNAGPEPYGASGSGWRGRRWWRWTRPLGRRPARRGIAAAASVPPCRLPARVDAADRDQRQGQVADLGEQAVEGRLVADRPGDGGLAGLVAVEVQAFEPGRPAAVQDALNADLVAHRRLGGHGAACGPAHLVSETTVATRPQRTSPARR